LHKLPFAGHYSSLQAAARIIDMTWAIERQSAQSWELIHHA
jgi:hypothetical protein